MDGDARDIRGKIPPEQTAGRIFAVQIRYHVVDITRKNSHLASLPFDADSMSPLLGNTSAG